MTKISHHLSNVGLHTRTEPGSFMGGDQINFFFATCNELVFFFFYFFQLLVLKYNEKLSLKLCHKINCCENKNKITPTKENTLKIATKLKLKIKQIR